MAESETSLDSIFETLLDQTTGAITRNDALVIAVHACLIADGFNLVAMGDEGFETGRFPKESVPLASSSSPILPKGWNASADVYTFQYRQTLVSERVCLLKILPVGDQLVINVLCSDKPSDLVTLTLSLDQYTTEMKGEGSKVTMATFRNVLKLFTTLNKEINSRIKQERGPTKAKPASSQSKKDTETKEDPLRIGDVRRPHPYYGADQSPFAYGTGDLSPFGGPGGMLMDPLRQGGGLRGPPLGPHPPGFVPPGARYDPVSPFGPNLYPGSRPGRQPGGGYGGMGGSMYGPDPDHLPPPGSDDWFS